MTLPDETPEDKRSPELLEQLHRRSRAYLRMWCRARKRGDDCRAKIRECAAVDNIIAAVVAARRDKPLPKQPNPRRLRRGINSGGRWFRTFSDVGPTKPWGERKKLGKWMAAWARKLPNKLTPLLTRDERSGRWRDDPGRWWSNHHEIWRMALAMREFEQNVTQILEASFTEDEDRSASSYGENAIGWLVGTYLPGLFEREFGLRATVNQSLSKKTGKSHVTRSPFVAFVQAVLIDQRITNADSPMPPGSIYHHLKQMKSKKEK